MDPVRTLDDSILVERHLFGLMDLDVAGTPSPWPQGPMPPDADVWVQVNRIDLRSTGEDHEAAVRLEAWDRPPEPPGGDGWSEWTDDGEAEVAFTSAEVQLWTLTSGPSGSALVLGPPAYVYGLRVFCRGHDVVAELTHDGLDIPDGTEQYVLQFRPLRPI
jgi:hypothetical protein